MSEEEAKALLLANASVRSLVPGSWLQLGIAEGGTSDLIGDIGLFLDEDGKSGELGFTLADGSQGKGHATRAVRIAVGVLFAASEATVVRAVTDIRNLSSVRVLKLAGFSFLSEQQCVFKGEACIEHVYGYRKVAA